MIKYFHEISDVEWDALKKTGMFWKQCAEEYAQPVWCNYPNAVDPMGCWSLIYRGIKQKKDCGNCELRKRIKRKKRKTVKK